VPYRYNLTSFCAVIAMAFASICFPLNALAQTALSANAPSAMPAMTISGDTLDKNAFQLDSLKGKVVLVMYWSTDCAICRDKMPELRENVLGWANKPFEVVLVSVDKHKKDVASYARILNQSVPVKQRFTQLWAGEPNYHDSLGLSQLPGKQLPTTFLIDKAGKIIERYNGRIPAEVWDKISDLL
jgi:thiol-disulfide isomerase/thioredoxin